MPILIIPIVLFSAIAFVFVNSDIYEKMREEKRKSPIEPKHKQEFEHLLNR